MMRSSVLLAAIAFTGCSYFQSAATPEGTPPPATQPSSARLPGAGLVFTNTPGLVKAMHDRYAGKYLKTMSFLQNNTRYTTIGQEQKSQWYKHIEIPGKLRIAFLPAAQRSGLVQVDDRVASFDNGIRVDFRRSVNPLLLLTADVYVAPIEKIMLRLDSLGIDKTMVRTDTWEGEPVYVVGA